jgi:hypothetical protein
VTKPVSGGPLDGSRERLVQMILRPFGGVPTLASQL